MRTLHIIGFAVLALSCNADDGNISQQQLDAEHEAYSVAIDSLGKIPVWIDVKPRSMVMIFDSTKFDGLPDRWGSGTFPRPTSSVEPFGYFKTISPGLDTAELRRDFLRANASPRLIDSSKLHSNFVARVIPTHSLLPMLKNESTPREFGLPDSILHWSNGAVILSRVGFSNSHRQALLHIFHSSYDHSTLRLILLRTNNNGWKIQGVCTIYQL